MSEDVLLDEHQPAFGEQAMKPPEVGAEHQKSASKESLDFAQVKVPGSRSAHLAESASRSLASAKVGKACI